MRRGESPFRVLYTPIGAAPGRGPGYQKGIKPIRDAHEYEKGSSRSSCWKIYLRADENVNVKDMEMRKRRFIHGCLGYSSGSAQETCSGLGVDVWVDTQPERVEDALLGPPPRSELRVKYLLWARQPPTLPQNQGRRSPSPPLVTFCLHHTPQHSAAHAIRPIQC